MNGEVQAVRVLTPDPAVVGEAAGHREPAVLADRRTTVRAASRAPLNNDSSA